MLHAARPFFDEREKRLLLVIFLWVTQVRHAVLRAAGNDAVSTHQPGEMRRAEHDPRGKSQVLTQPLQRPVAKGVAQASWVGLNRFLEQSHIPIGCFGRAASTGRVGQRGQALGVETVDDLTDPRVAPLPSVRDLAGGLATGREPHDLCPPDDSSITTGAD